MRQQTSVILISEVISNLSSFLQKSIPFTKKVRYISLVRHQDNDTDSYEYMSELTFHKRFRKESDVF